MVTTFIAAASGVKRHFQSLLPEQFICNAARSVGHRWRDRRFNPAITIHLFILQMLHANTAILHLRHLTGQAVNAGAFCKARMRLPLALFEMLLEKTAADLIGQCRQITGPMRVILVDAVSSITPDTRAIRKLFRQPGGLKRGCGLPMAKVLALVDAASGAILKPLIGHLFQHEGRQVFGLHPQLRAGDLLVGDRAFCSYSHLALLAAINVMGLFRVHTFQEIDFCKRELRAGRGRNRKGKLRSRRIKRLGHLDQLMEWHRPHKKPPWMTRRQFQSLPPTLLVREVRYTLAARGQRTRQVTIGTTLLDAKAYPASEIGRLYGLRWQIETHFAQMKTTMGMRRLKCQSIDGVKKELLSCFIAYNLICQVMAKAAQRQQVPIARISFKDAMRWLAIALENQEMGDLVVLPSRPDRHEPRRVKHMRNRYGPMPRPRAQLKSKPYLYGGKPK